MRLDPIDPTKLSAEQRPLHESIKANLAAHMHSFVSARADGALIGPFTSMLHFPQYGAAVWGVNTALGKNSTLPKGAHEVAILVTGARFGSRYELYAHEKVAAGAGLSAAVIATIAAGQRPADLSSEEAVAYDVAAALTRGGPLPESTYQVALAAFGEKGTAELIYLVGFYCLISVLLNGYDMSVPGTEEGLG